MRALGGFRGPEERCRLTWLMKAMVSRSPDTPESTELHEPPPSSVRRMVPAAPTATAVSPSVSTAATPCSVRELPVTLDATQLHPPTPPTEFRASGAKKASASNGIVAAPTIAHVEGGAKRLPRATHEGLAGDPEAKAQLV